MLMTNEVMQLELTRFETARIIGARALQIAYGAPIMIEVPKGSNRPLNPVDIAKLELQNGAVPVSVKRSA